ncbi:SGNH/GDSL hydrolase family protein [bacterium]|jgi:lysophospholipase L1-like esterase|nr:SGNH/GDSL hydrolase family protein [bacterium]MDA7880337.1 SGNH/GDSL hydrolase family protein [Mariniblastus sp.]
MTKLFFALILSLTMVHSAVAQSEPQDSHDSSRWLAAIAKFEAADKEKMPPKNAILFVGSSSIRLWNLSKSFPNLITINRGFGGSQLADSVQFIDRIILNYDPQSIVMYAGDNDIKAGKSPQRVFADFAEFVAIVRKKLPAAKIHYVAIKPSISRWQLVTQMRKTNGLIESYCNSDELLFFVDIDKPMLGTDQKPRPELFAKDGLHLNVAGYVLWNKVLKESLRQSGCLENAKTKSK